MKQFEFFLWRDIDPQPHFGYIKRAIAAAVDVSAHDFTSQTLTVLRVRSPLLQAAATTTSMTATKNQDHRMSCRQDWLWEDSRLTLLG